LALNKPQVELVRDPGRPSVVVLLAVRDDDVRMALEQELRAIPDLRVTVTVARDLDAARRVASRMRFEVLVMELSMLDGSARAAELVSELAFLIPTVVIGPSGSTERSRVALRVGARDFVAQDEQFAQNLPRAVRAAMAVSCQKVGRARGVPRVVVVQGRLVGFVGIRGGVGTTTALLNCAVALAQGHRSVIAAELSTWTSSFAAQLRQQPSLTLADLLTTPGHIGQVTERYLAPLLPGVRLLYGSATPRAPSPDDAELFDRVINVLGYQADYVLVDLPANLPELHRRVVRHLDHVVVVIDRYKSSLAVAVETIARLDAWGVARACISLLAIDKDLDCRDTRPAEALASELGFSLIGSVPAAPIICSQASGRGVPVLQSAAGHALSASLTAAAAELVKLVDYQRLKVAVVNADDGVTKTLSDLLKESEAVRFELTFASSVDEMLEGVTQGAFHAVLLVPRGSGEDFQRDLSRMAILCERIALVVVAPVADSNLVKMATAAGAQDCVHLPCMTTIWLVHCLLSSIERQRVVYRLHVRNRELETCELGYRKMIIQVLRERHPDQGMV